MGYWPRIQKQSIIGLIYHISYTYTYIYIYTYIYREREREKKKKLLLGGGSIRDLGQAGCLYQVRDTFRVQGLGFRGLGFRAGILLALVPDLPAEAKVLAKALVPSSPA